MPAWRITHLPARFFISMSVFLLSSCLLLDKPLSDPEKAKPVTQLFGVWKLMGEEVKRPEFALLFIGKSGIRGAPSGVMKMVLCGNDKENNIDTQSWYFIPSLLGDRSYINLVVFWGAGPNKAIPASWDKRKIEGYGLLKIKVEEDKLVFWFGDREAAKAAIQKGQLTGKAKIGWLDIPIFAGGESLSRFLADGGDKVLFPDTDKKRAVFTRLK